MILATTTEAFTVITFLLKISMGKSCSFLISVLVFLVICQIILFSYFSANIQNDFECFSPNLVCAVSVHSDLFLFIDQQDTTTSCVSVLHGCTELQENNSTWTWHASSTIPVYPGLSHGTASTQELRYIL